ncbi:MAG: alpha/beta fold hydrolase [Micrococcales bacterium]
MTALPLTRTYQDAQGVEITMFEWPVAEPRAIVQLVHGLGEHTRRYDHVAAALNRAGFSVYSDDHRGHGATGQSMIMAGITAKLGPLGPGGMVATMAEVHQLTELIRAENPAAPIVLFGHSLGAMMAQRLINKYPTEYFGAILSGSTLLLPGVVPSDGFNKRWANTPGGSGKEWLSSDERVGHAFMNDPLCFPDSAAKAFGLVNASKVLGLPSKKLPSDMPILIFAGSEDPLGAERGNKMLLNAYRRAGVRDVTLMIYEGMRHETLNEKEGEGVIDDVIAWINQSLEI